MNNIEFSTIKNAVKQAEPVFKDLIPDLFQDFKNIFEKKICSGIKPTIMLYGMYSHGKSTLINALLGKNVADIGRPPTTDKISTYEWENGNCTLIDTPGIQARLQDTKITEEQLKQCELVVFVVESGMVENHLVWDTLVRLVKQKQKVCLFINDFDKCRDDPNKFEPLKDKFRTNLQRSAHELGFEGDIASMVPMLIADARMALKGKLEQKRALVEHSGLIQVEGELIHMAASIDRSDVINTLRRNVQLMIEVSRGKLAAKRGNELLVHAEEQLSAIKSERERAYSAIELELDDRIASLRDQLYQIFSQNSTEEFIRANLSSLVEGLISEMNEVIKRESSRAAKQIRLFCQEFDQACTRIQIEQEERGESADMSSKTNLAMVDWQKLLDGMGLENLVKDAVVKALEQFKSWFPQLLAGKGSATFAKWAGMFTNVIGAIITIGSILFQMYNESKAEQEARDRAMRQAQAIADAVKSTQQKLHSAILAQVKEIFNESFDVTITEISKQVRVLRQQSIVDDNQQKLLDTAAALLAI